MTDFDTNVSEVAEIVDKVVREVFADSQVHRVTASPNRDYDGDPILDVLVVFSTSKRPDARRMLSITRLLREALRSEESSSPTVFPVVSFAQEKRQSSRKQPAAA